MTFTFHRWSFRVSQFFATVLFSSISVTGFCDSGLEKKATWGWPTAPQLENAFQSHLERYNEQSNDPFAQKENLIRDWNDAASSLKGPQLLDSWLRLISPANPNLKELLSGLVSANRAAGAAEVLSEFQSLSAGLQPYIEQNLRLAVGRHLAQNQLYDEALDVLEPVDVDEVIDPSTLLFYRAVAFHNILRRDECLASIDQLLQRESELVSRYAVLSKLMRADIQPMEEDSLDEIARLMNDVKRRLDLERSGKIVRDQEDTIIEKLDKKIDEIEDQLQQMQQQQSQAQQQESNPNSQPMKESQAAGGSGPGDVEKKNIGKSSGWGDLPPAERQEALQNMTQDLPSHYREIIEAYFKRLASEPQ